MGGALAVIGAARHQVSRLVLIAPYFNLAADSEGIFEAGAKVVRWIVPVIPKYKKAQMFDPAAYREYETGSYSRLPAGIPAAGGAVPGWRGTWRRTLAVPTLVLASEKDTVASFSVTRRFCDACPPASLVLCNQGNHILTYDFGREQVLGADRCLPDIARRVGRYEASKGILNSVAPDCEEPVRDRSRTPHQGH